eukprot:13646297-Alexandrium_andersonii.AAC.1
MRAGLRDLAAPPPDAQPARRPRGCRTLAGPRPGSPGAGDRPEGSARERRPRRRIRSALRSPWLSRSQALSYPRWSPSRRSR